MTPLLSPPVPNEATARLRWHQLYGSAAALALAEAMGADRRLYVVIVDDALRRPERAAEAVIEAQRNKRREWLPPQETRGINPLDDAASFGTDFRSVLTASMERSHNCAPFFRSRHHTNRRFPS